MIQICNQIFAYMITGHSVALYSVLESAKKARKQFIQNYIFQKNFAQIVNQITLPKIALFLGFLQY